MPHLELFEDRAAAARARLSSTAGADAVAPNEGDKRDDRVDGGHRRRAA